jgi:hypothetical protein
MWKLNLFKVLTHIFTDVTLNGKAGIAVSKVTGYRLNGWGQIPHRGTTSRVAM